MPPLVVVVATSSQICGSNRIGTAKNWPLTLFIQGPAGNLLNSPRITASPLQETMETNSTTPADDAAMIALTNADLDSISEPSRVFIGNWHAVVSQTNWEKGQIIFEWRRKLEDAGISARLYSDPAWSRLVGEVSPQHVGRLRRTWERFGEVYGDYPGLYWSHFFAALDWHDAEMWLEGAVQNHWSVSKMRFQRWETTGAIAGQQPDPLEIVSAEGDEGVRIPAVVASPDEIVRRDDLPPTAGPVFEGPDFGEDNHRRAAPTDERETAADLALAGNHVDIQATLEQLPGDLAKPFVQLREAIIRYRADDWNQVQRIHVVALLNDLRQLLRKPPARDT